MSFGIKEPTLCKMHFYKHFSFHELYNLKTKTSNKFRYILFENTCIIYLRCWQICA